jgi:hypothetical protein
MSKNSRTTEAVHVYAEDAKWIRKLAAVRRKSEADVIEEAMMRPDRFAHLPPPNVCLGRLNGKRKYELINGSKAGDEIVADERAC